MPRTISNNRAGDATAIAIERFAGGGQGGGVYNTGTLTVDRSSISGNSCGNGGSGVGQGFSGGVGGSGGGVWNGGQLTMLSCTVASNLCGNGGDAGPWNGRPYQGGGGG